MVVALGPITKFASASCVLPSGYLKVWPLSVKVEPHTAVADSAIVDSTKFRHETCFYLESGL